LVAPITLEVTASTREGRLVLVLAEKAFDFCFEVLNRLGLGAEDQSRHRQEDAEDQQVMGTKTSWVNLLDQAGLRPRDPFEVDELMREERF
jgi:hypothetical protein